jgi:methyltransferase-like protein
MAIIMPTERSPELQDCLDKMTEGMFGRKQSSAVCVTCGSDAVKTEDFKDALSEKEFSISGMCQRCQDAIWDY